MRANMETLFDHLIDRVKNEKNMDYLTDMVNRRGLHEIWEALPDGACVHCLYMEHFPMRLRLKLAS